MEVMNELREELRQGLTSISTNAHDDYRDIQRRFLLIEARLGRQEELMHAQYMMHYNPSSSHLPQPPQHLSSSPSSSPTRSPSPARTSSPLRRTTSTQSSHAMGGNMYRSSSQSSLVSVRSQPSAKVVAVVDAFTRAASPSTREEKNGGDENQEDTQLSRENAIAHPASWTYEQSFQHVTNTIHDLCTTLRKRIHRALTDDPHHPESEEWTAVMDQLTAWLKVLDMREATVFTPDFFCEGLVWLERWIDDYSHVEDIGDLHALVANLHILRTLRYFYEQHWNICLTEEDAQARFHTVKFHMYLVLHKMREELLDGRRHPEENRRVLMRDCAKLLWRMMASIGRLKDAVGKQSRRQLATFLKLCDSFDTATDDGRHLPEIVEQYADFQLLRKPLAATLYNITATKKNKTKSAKEKGKEKNKEKNKEKGKEKDKEKKNSRSERKRANTSFSEHNKKQRRAPATDDVDDEGEVDVEEMDEMREGEEEEFAETDAAAVESNHLQEDANEEEAEEEAEEAEAEEAEEEEDEEEEDDEELMQASASLLPSQQMDGDEDASYCIVDNPPSPHCAPQGDEDKLDGDHEEDDGCDATMNVVDREEDVEEEGEDVEEEATVIDRPEELITPTITPTATQSEPADVEEDVEEEWEEIDIGGVTYLTTNPHNGDIYTFDESGEYPDAKVGHFVDGVAVFDADADASPPSGIAIAQTTVVTEDDGEDDGDVAGGAVEEEEEEEEEEELSELSIDGVMYFCNDAATPPVVYEALSNGEVGDRIGVLVDGVLQRDSIVSTTGAAEETQEEETQEEETQEEEEQELEEVVIDGVSYLTDNPQNGGIYLCDEGSDDVGEQVGHFENGEPVFDEDA